LGLTNSNQLCDNYFSKDYHHEQLNKQQVSLEVMLVKAKLLHLKV
jgi:hypothetical protein